MKAGLYSVPLTGLKEGCHVYEFDVDNEFFSSFSKSEIQEGDLKVRVNLLKRSLHFEADISIEGEVSVICDRCLEIYRQELSYTDHMLIKFGDHWEEVDDEVLMIPHGSNEFDIAQLIYEFAHLGLPIQRFHPLNKDGSSGCNPDMLSKIEDHQAEETERIDPRWSELQKLKDNIN